MEFGIALGVMGAVIAFGVAGTGCGIAMGMIGQAAAGVVAEDPRKFGQTLVLQAVGTTSGIYGLLMGFLILQKALLVTDTATGFYLLAAGIPMGIVGCVASIGQAKALVAGVILVGKRSSEMAKALIYAAMVETMQIFGLLLSFMIYNSI
jgi:V/A-type H+-transporting ATPase subunit K